MNPKLEAAAEEVRNGVWFCKVCLGQLEGRCVICKQRNSHIRKEFPELTEHWAYIIKTRRKMIVFNQPSTGVGSVDEDCREIGKLPTRRDASK